MVFLRIILVDFGISYGEHNNYNAKLLGREHHPPQFQELYKLKKDLMELVTERKIEVFETLKEEEYLRVVKKVCHKGKNMFLDFI